MTPVLGVLLAMAFAACGNDPTGAGDAGARDLGAVDMPSIRDAGTVTDTGTPGPPDAGPMDLGSSDGAMPDQPDAADPCADVANPCSMSSVSCANGAVQRCEQDADGCLVLTAEPCEDGFQCEENMGAAECVCVGDPRCPGLSACSGGVYESCVTVAGCDVVDTERCERGTCGASGCEPPADGLSCADPIQIPREGFTYYGTNLGASSSNITVGGCEYLTSPNLLFSIELLAGETPFVETKGEIRPVAFVLDSCGNGATCSLNGFTAPVDGTYTIGLFARDVRDSGRYEMKVRLPNGCGDGFRERIDPLVWGDGCDDGNTVDGDGCDADCRLVWPYSCDQDFSPGRCDIWDLGQFAAGDPIPQQGGPRIHADQLHRYVLEFTEDTHLFVDVQNLGLGAIEYRIHEETSRIYPLFDSAERHAHSHPSYFLPAGRYVIELNGDDLVTTTYELNLRTERVSCGDGNLAPTENCDDGNATDADGCTNCQIDSGYSCSFAPSQCWVANPGDSCATPMVVTGSTTFSVDWRTLSADYDAYDGFQTSACRGLAPDYAGGREMVLQIELEQGATLRDVVATFDGGRLARATLRSCTDPTNNCSEYEDFAFDYLHRAGLAETVYVVLEPFREDIGNVGMVTVDVVIETLECGDGDRRSGVEVCDDGNTTAGDGCEADCTLTPGWTCGTSESPDSKCWPVGSGDDCSAPISLDTGYYYLNLRTSAMDYDSYLCPDGNLSLFSTAGNDEVFEVVVPAGGALLSGMTRYNQNTRTPVYQALLQTCGQADSCLAQETYQDDTFRGIYYENTTGADQTRYIVADSEDYAFDPFYWNGEYDLDVELRAPGCGNGHLEAGETCDDGNAVPGDGCSACAVDAGHICRRAPGVRSAPDSCAASDASATDSISSLSIDTVFYGLPRYYERTVQIPQSCIVDGVTLEAEVDGNTAIWLTSPSGTTARVRFGQISSAPGQQTYHVWPLVQQTNPADSLSEFVGEDGQGIWRFGAEARDGWIGPWTLHLDCN